MECIDLTQTEINRTENDQDILLYMDKLKSLYLTVLVLLPKSNIILFVISLLFQRTDDHTLNTLAYYLFFILMILFFLRISIILHELGHYIISIMTGIKSRRIVLGIGKEILRFKINGSTLIINKNLVAGANYLHLQDTSFFRIKLFVTSIGGIIVNSTLCLFAIYIVSLGTDNPTDICVLVGETLLVANFTLLLSAIIPWKPKFMGVPMPNDGLLAINALFASKNHYKEYKISGKIIDFLEQYEVRDYNKCLNILNELIEAYPDLVVPKINLSLVYLELERYSESEALLKDILKDEANTRFELLIKNNLAWTLLLKDDIASLEEADKISAEAYKKHNKFYNLLGTRGCILIELGRFEEGQNLLFKAEKHKQNPQNDIAGLTYLAYAYYNQNKPKKVKALLKKVQTRYDRARISDKKIFKRLCKKMNT